MFGCCCYFAGNFFVFICNSYLLVPKNKKNQKKKKGEIFCEMHNDSIKAHKRVFNKSIVFFMV